LDFFFVQDFEFAGIMNILSILKDGLFFEIFCLVLVVRVIQSRRLDALLLPYITYPLIYQQLMEKSWRNKAILTKISEAEEHSAATTTDALATRKKIKLFKFEYNRANSSALWLYLGVGSICCVVLVYKPLVLLSIAGSDFILARAHHHIIGSF